MWIPTPLQLESKDQMRARGVPSPDEWDAVALTFAEPVSSTPSNFNRKLEYQGHPPSDRAPTAQVLARAALGGQMFSPKPSSQVNRSGDHPWRLTMSSRGLQA
jgi:hypothetical protein